MKSAKFVSLAVVAACCAGAGAVELTHRWSFNAADDYTDSVGGVVAAKMGTALHIADGKVVLNDTGAKRLALDPAGITLPQGYRAFLKRSGDNLFLRIDKLGAALIIR